MDRLFAAVLEHYGVSIPHLVAETSYQRYHKSKLEFAARSCHSATHRREAILRSLPPSIVPLSITVGRKPHGLVRVRKLHLDKWDVMGYSSASQTLLMIRNSYLAVTMQESLLGRPLNSVIEAPYVDDRPIQRIVKYSLDNHKGTAFIVKPEVVKYSAGDLVYRPINNSTPHKGPFTDKNGKEWQNLAQLITEAQAVPSRTIKRDALHLSLHDVAVYGGKPQTVLKVAPQSKTSKNPQVHMTGGFFDFIFQHWIVPCDRLDTGELVANVEAAKTVMFD